MIFHNLKNNALGIGLRPKHYKEILNDKPKLDFFEIIIENYLGESSHLAKQKLKQISEYYPIVGHSISMNLMGTESLDLKYLDSIKSVVKEFNIPYVSDHLCWNATGKFHHHDLLPAPYHSDIIPYVSKRAKFIQEYLEIPFGIENLSSYISWKKDEMQEWEFYNSIIKESGCFYMLDINNVYVSSMNHNFDSKDYLDSIIWEKVLQVHLAGHKVLGNGIIHDTHDRAISKEVWNYYKYAWETGGPFRTLIEWDENIPNLKIVIDELDKTKQYR